MSLVDFFNKLLGVRQVELKESDLTPNTDTTTALAIGMKSQDPLIRAISVDSVWHLKEKALIPDLIKALKDPLHLIRQKAAQALGLI